MKNLGLFVLTCAVAVTCKADSVFVQDREVFVHDANYDKGKIPPYTLEDPLVFADGRKVSSAADWAHGLRRRCVWRAS